jgi:hypothetical protein
VAKATDYVKFPQTWPHVALQDDFSNQSLEFNDLDFRLFVAGELEIATSQDIQEGERAGRLRLLKQLAYLNGAHQWDIIKKIYVAIVRKIELGSLHWGSCFLNDIQWILTKHTVTSHPQPSRNINTAQAQPRSIPLYCIEFTEEHARSKKRFSASSGASKNGCNTSAAGVYGRIISMQLTQPLNASSD